MSRVLAPGEEPVIRGPEEQVAFLADVYQLRSRPGTAEQLGRRARELGLAFTERELTILAALETPAKVQEFLNTQIYYNNDHSPTATEETAISPRQVLRATTAHCFEGAMFAYTVNYLHGHSPRLVLLEASQDSEHNLVLFRDPATRMYGVNAHSAFPHLDGRPAQFHSISAIAESYYPYYYSDRTMNPSDLTLVGYSEPIDLVAKFGVEWMGRELPLWDIYYTYVDDAVKLHYLFDSSDRSHLYPLVCALKASWIEIRADNTPSLNVQNLPEPARELWASFWHEYDPQQPRPRGAARKVEKKFFDLTGTTPIDLNENLDELAHFLERGYRIEQLLTQST